MNRLAVVVSALALCAASASADVLTEAELDREYRNCIASTEKGYIRHTQATMLCTCMKFEIRDMPLQRWLTINGEIQRRLNEGLSGEAAIRSVPEAKALANTCRSMASLPEL